MTETDLLGNVLRSDSEELIYWEYVPILSNAIVFLGEKIKRSSLIKRK